MTLNKKRIFRARREDGFRSPLEAEISKSFPKRKGMKVTYETHSISYSVPHVYNPDFTVVLPSGRTFHIEVKGWFRIEDKAKMKWVKECNPTLDIRMMFPKKQKKDIKWCEKHGFPWAVGTKPPKEWFYG